MRSFIKKIPKTAFGQSFIALLIAVYLHIIKWTCKFHITGQNHILKLANENQPFVLAIWHGRLLLMPLLFPKKVKAYCLISDHSDGRIVKKAARIFGYKTIVGSSSKGGATALKRMIKAIKSDHSLFITPDGPKGPRAVFQPGAADVARLTNSPIVAVSVSASPAKFAKSWDNFMIPKPFSDIYIHYSAPLYNDKKTHTKEHFYKVCEEQLNQAEEKVDKLSGVVR